ncbi:tubulin-specific chaperone E-like [Panonychus citri]|uniref:tubulin-specific chaperone E-like n=1 Tax=Panonychus citri TaxID=50023 RepID=UPI0023077DDF|nr:tubulin-specific chaperone E-like [Panonychus citri]
MDQSSDRVSLTKAITSKYLDDDTLDEEPGISFPTLGGGKRNLLYERSEKLNRELRALDKRIEIDLKFCSIGTVDIDTDLFDKLKNVQVLDVSFNHLSSWSQIATIVDCFQSLKHIIVTGNPLKTLDNDKHSDFISSFRKLNTITLGKLNYNWEQIIECSQRLWPHIEQLDVFSNSINEIATLSTTTLENLTSLTLDHNKITHWRYINKLGHLKKLTTLKLVNCDIESVVINRDENLFPNLIHLDLKSNRIQLWKDIANLNNLPSLEELIIRDNPLFEEINFDYAFNFVLSIIGNLKILNRAKITNNLRKDGEIHYLRFYYLKYLRSIENGDRTFLEDNPRYLHILEEYGTPVDLVPGNKMKPQSKLIGLTIRNSLDDSTISKKVPRTTTISALKKLVNKLLSIDDSTEIFLWLKSRNDNNQEIEYHLDKEEHNLDFYSVKENDIIVVKFN